MLDIFTKLALYIWVYVSIIFVIAALIKRMDIIDIGWGGGFLVVLFTLLNTPEALTQGIGYPAYCVALLVMAWAIRLIIYLGFRNMAYTQEDARYAHWRRNWKFFHLRSYFQLYIVQGILMILISSPIIAVFIAANPNPTLAPFFVVSGILVWLIGFIFEAVGDHQLSQFKSNPENAGVLMTTGLWKYTRHPNYFGEVAQWWGIGLAALGGLSPSEPLTMLYALTGPAIISFFIMRVTGVPMLERMMKHKPGWEDYKARTSKFFPALPRTLEK